MFYENGPMYNVRCASIGMDFTIVIVYFVCYYYVK